MSRSQTFEPAVADMVHAMDGERVEPTESPMRGGKVGALSGAKKSAKRRARARRKRREGALGTVGTTGVDRRRASAFSFGEWPTFPSAPQGMPAAAVASKMEGEIAGVSPAPLTEQRRSAIREEAEAAALRPRVEPAHSASDTDTY
jgi:hypothetical protein